jgi:hypothetical protein
MIIYNDGELELNVSVGYRVNSKKATTEALEILGRMK